MRRFFGLLMMGAFIVGAATAQTPEQLAKVFAEDQLSAEKCGAPRNAADDYRPKPMTPDQTRAPRVATKAAFHVEEVASGLPHAWGLAFLPSGNMLVTVRGEGLKTVTPKGQVSDLIAGTPPIKSVVRLFGMHDVILDKDFARNRTIYFAYVTQVDGGAPNTGYIAKAKLSTDEKSVSDFVVLKEGAFTPRRVVQAKDGALFILTADILPGYKFAQALNSAQGKVLRIGTDGKPPKDNPFVATAGADPSVYALGVRDPQGMAFDPKTGELWINENEPRGGDELNLIQAGKNYGFPLISYGRDNDGTPLNGGKTAETGLEQPVYFWTPSVAFSGFAFYIGKAMPEWQGDMFMGGLSGMQLVRLVLKDGRVVGEEKLLRDRCERIRDVRMGPDGNLYLLTDADAGKILRLVKG